MLSTRSSCSSLLRRHHALNEYLTLASRGTLVVLRRHFTIPRTERLTTSRSASLSDSYVDVKGGRHGTMGSHSPNESVCESVRSTPFAFAVKDEERGLFDHGVSPEAKDFIAEAERDYQISSDHLHAPMEGQRVVGTYTEYDVDSGTTVTVRRIAAPFGEQCVPSHKERFAYRGHVGELERQRNRQPFLLDEHAQLNLKKERQLGELLTSPMPALPKAHEVTALLCSFYDQGFALQPRTAEAVMLLYSRQSLQLRLEGSTSVAPLLSSVVRDAELAMNGASKGRHVHQSETQGRRLENQRLLDGVGGVPFLTEMRHLYTHQKRCFVAPTPLMMEHMMVTLNAIPEPSKAAFHLANRLLLDGDKYDVLPTRTTYAAYFSICQINDAMPFAVARWKDAIQNLNVSVDSVMAVGLLKGLVETGYVEEAVAVLARLEHVPLTVALLNVSLETLLFSGQPLACFSVYEALQPASLTPNAETYTLLLLACEQSGQWERVTFLLADMQRRKVKGSQQTLNLLLKGLLKEGLISYAAQLHATMMEKQVGVWPALESGVQDMCKGERDRRRT